MEILIIPADDRHCVMVGARSMLVVYASYQVTTASALCMNVSSECPCMHALWLTQQACKYKFKAIRLSCLQQCALNAGPSRLPFGLHLGHPVSVLAAVALRMMQE